MLKLMPRQFDIESVKKYMLIDTSQLSVVLLQEVKHCKIGILTCKFYRLNDTMHYYLILQLHSMIYLRVFKVL